MAVIIFRAKNLLDSLLLVAESILVLAFLLSFFFPLVDGETGQNEKKKKKMEKEKREEEKERERERKEKEKMK